MTARLFNAVVTARSVAHQARVGTALDALAERERLTDPALSREQAIAKALAREPHLYDRLKAGQAQATAPDVKLAKVQRAVAQDTIERATDAEMKADPKATRAVAMSRALDKNPTLYDAYRAGRAGGRV